MSATSALEALLQDFSRERSSPRAVCRRASRVVRKQSVILHSRSRARRDRCGISLAPDALAEPSPRKRETADASSALTPSRRSTARAWRRASTKPSPALLARAATSVAARAWAPSVGGAPGSPPGASRATVSGAARSHCVREGRKGITVRRRNSGGHGRGTLTRHETRSSAFCGRRPRGDSPPGAIAASVGERRRAHAPDLIFVGIFDLFVRRVRLELGVGHVACRYVATVARIWKARVLMERGFVSRRVARFEAAQASLWARSGCPITCV